jgi:hypothetical protein
MATGKTKEWSEFPLEQYQQEASRLVHFSRSLSDMGTRFG